MIRTIHLHGKLKKDFGASHRFDVATAAEALRALNCAFPGRFIEALREGSYKLVRGDRHNGMQLDLDLVKSLNLGAADLHLIPVPKGAAMSKTAKGTTKVVLGAALVGGAIFLSNGMLAAPLSASGVLGGVTYGNIALVGLGLALAGASTLLSKSGETNKAGPSTDINTGSIGNSGQQGNAIPLIYGECLVGSTPISVQSEVEDIDVYANQSGSIEQSFGHNPAYWNGQS